MFARGAAGPLRGSGPLLAYNKSRGHRWSVIPKPPPPHYDRLCGVHSVLNVLRVAAAAVADASALPPPSSSAPSPPPVLWPLTQGQRRLDEGAEEHTTSVMVRRVVTGQSEERREGPSVAQRSVSAAHPPPRAHLARLYVRDFSLEASEAEGREVRSGKGFRHHNESMRQGKSAKFVPMRYTALRCIIALAKSLEVPVEFVSRAELVQLCGERRNQNVVLEASTYTPRSIRHLGEIWGLPEGDAGHAPLQGTMTTAPSPHPLDQRNDPVEKQTRPVSAQTTAVTSESTPLPQAVVTVLFLENVIDPANVGGILRSAFFFGVDHVVLSRHCAACTPAVSRTSTGFLEHLCVYRASVSSDKFLRDARNAWAAAAAGAGDIRLEIAASAVVNQASVTPRPCVGSCDAPPSGHESSGPATRQLCSSGQGRHPSASPHPFPAVRVLLLGNEDAGLPPELLRWCTHIAHVRSPRQSRLCQARATARVRLAASADGDGEGAENDEGGGVEAPPRLHTELSELEKRAHSLRRLTRLRQREVSLNVNTASAVLLSAFTAMEKSPLESGRYGLVEVTTVTDAHAAEQRFQSRANISTPS